MGNHKFIQAQDAAGFLLEKPISKVLKTPNSDKNTPWEFSPFAKWKTENAADPRRQARIA